MRQISLTFTSFAATPALLLATAAVQAESLQGNDCDPVEIDLTVFAPTQDTFVRLEQDGRYVGNAGCNSFRRQYSAKDDALVLEPTAATMMTCPGDIAQQETQFLNALSSGRTFERDGAELSLFDDAGERVMRLQHINRD